MASFAKEITTPIAVPSVKAPDVSKNTSTAQDIASIATFGLGLLDRNKAQEKEATRQATEIDMNAFVDGLVLSYQNMTDQPGGRAKALRNIQKQISDKGTPLQSSFINQAFGQRLAVMEQGVSQTVVGAPEDSFDLTKKYQGVALHNAELTSVPAKGTLERDRLNIAMDALHSDDQRLANDSKAAQNAAKGSREEIGKLGISTQKVLSNQMKPLVVKMTELLESTRTMPGNEQLTLLNGLRENMTIAKQLAIDSVDDSFQGVDAEDSKGTRDALLAQIDRLFKPFEDADAAEMQRSATNLTFLTEKLKLDMFQASNVMAITQAAYGKQIPELMWSQLSKGGSLSLSLEEGIESVLGLTSAQKKEFTLHTLQEYVNGGGSLKDVGKGIPMSKEGRALIYKNGFEMYERNTKDGELLNLDNVGTAAATRSMAHILQDSSSKDSATNSRIVDWISHPNFGELMKKADPDTQSAIGNMVITKTKTHLRSADGPMGSINKFPELFTFNVKTGQFERSAAALSVSNIPRPASEQIARDTARGQVSKANRNIKTFLDNAKHNPALATLTKEQQLNWFLKGGAGSPMSGGIKITNGSLKPIVGNEAEAVERGVSLKQVEDEKAFIAEQASEANQVLQLQEQLKKMRHEGAGFKEEVNTDDMDDDTFAEFQRLQLEDRKPKPNVAKVSESE